jgi:hypothetical protein
MNAAAVIGIVVGVIGAVASVVALILYIRRRPKKLLIWEAASRVPVASILPHHESDYRISIQYEREGQPPVTAEGLNLYFVRLANFGAEPIRETDLTATDPLRLEIHHRRVLDVSLAAVTRTVTNFRVHAFKQEGDTATAELTFDFLDDGDGAMLRVLTTHPTADFRLRGTIIGQPQGILSPGDERHQGRWRFVFAIGLTILFYLAAIIGTVGLFLALVDDAALLWLLWLPIAALILPGLVAGLLVMPFFGPIQWPEPIRRPAWAIAAGVTPGAVRFSAGFRVEREGDVPPGTTAVR